MNRSLAIAIFLGIIFFSGLSFASTYTALVGTREKPDVSVKQNWTVPDPRPNVLTLSGLVKGVSLGSIDDDHEGLARVTIAFLDKEGKILMGPKEMVSWRGTFEWLPWTVISRVPDKASQLELSLELAGAVGKAQFDQLELLWGFPEDYDRNNLITDGGFEYVNALSLWNLGKNTVPKFPGFRGRSALEIRSREAGFFEASQDWMMGEWGLKKIRCSLQIKLDKVKPMEKDSGGAHVVVEFLNASDQFLKKEVVFGPLRGTKDWSQLTKEILVPGEADKGRIQLILENATGGVLFDEVRIEDYSDKRMVERLIESRNDTHSWKPYRVEDESLVGPLDASHLLDAPAGKHGFLKVRDGKFVFEDGTPTKFLGVNIQAEHALPDHQKAESMAKRLAQLGFNIVRLHHLDAPWAERNLFDPSYNDTQHFSPENLDRLDYFLAQLKAYGIYVYLDLLVSREFKSEDRVVNYRQLSKGAKIVAEFDPRIIELEKKYAHDLLLHMNPYTQTRLIDEPAIALIDLINESSVFLIPWRMNEIPPYYRKQLQDLWKNFLKVSLRAPKERSPDAAGVRTNKDSFNRPFRRKGRSNLNDDFYTAIQSKYFQQVSGYLRGLGLRIPISGSNLPIKSKGDLATNASLDYIDRHVYWDHPKGGFGDLVKFHNQLLVDSFDQNNPIAQLNSQRTKDRPFVVGEWNIAWPNEYRAVSPLFMIAHAMLQDWDGLLFFNFDGEMRPERIKGNFDISSKPEIFLQFPALARTFYHRDGASIEAACGRLGGKTIQLKNATLNIITPFAVFILTGLDNQPIDVSRHLLMTTLARSENKNTVYNATRTLLRNSGDSPILMEGVEGTAALTLGDRPQPKIFGLNTLGAREKEIHFEWKNGKIKIPLGEFFQYEIIFGETQ